ncbi:nucleoside/nucleotide kinase family protein [Mycoplasmopsis alligatoris]|uniref:Putative dephospho-CoA kinase n=1 Tax=Mycoplasmopsis alligatoris A21JP2 TaxID=747682 RepID=D4XW48_9BACT|nr:dephospho-CoA kinase [Mycoplasmopsis alligatoris]EFF41402.1 putative dephospho-CoA kinase [Mycoplasmopsis alligatoris A21JP2]
MIAIIGQVAAGKSLLLHNLNKLGYKTFSCDVFVHELYEKEFFIEQINNLINKKTKHLKEEIIAWLKTDKNNIYKLENIVFPHVYRHLQNNSYDFVEIPVLQSLNWDFSTFFKAIIKVVISEEKREQNLKFRNVNNSLYDELNQKNHTFLNKNELFNAIPIVNISYENVKTIQENDLFFRHIKHYL